MVSRPVKSLYTENNLSLRQQTYRKLTPLKILILKLEPDPGLVDEYSMMDVSWYKYSFILVSCALAISGCKDPEVSVGLLGKKLSAPALTGASPFDQDMKTNGYVRFQGSCDSRVQYISISLDETNYFIVPSAPNISGTALTGSEVNDTSCESDGHFDFYLTENDLISWGYSADEDVDVLFLRGTMSFGETRVLKIQDPNPDSGNGGGTATQVVLEKNWPAGFAGSSQCEYFNASIRNANGNHTTSTTATTFSLDKVVGNTTSRNIVAYKNQSDCASSTNGSTTFSIPAGENSITVYYKFPDAPLDDIIKFRTSSVNLSTTESAFASVVLRDSTGDRYWISSFSPYKVAKDTCAKGNFEARFYNGTVKSLYSSNAWTPVVTGTNSGKLFFYSDENCVNKVTAINGNSGNTTFYYKYNSGGETDTTTLKFTLTHNVDTATFGAYDDNVHNFEIDRSGNTTVTKFDFYVPTTGTTSRGICQQTQINTYNSQGTSIDSSIHVFMGAPNTAFFASYNDCETVSNPITSLSLTKSQTPVFYRTTALPSAVETLSMTSSSLPAVTRQITVSSKATHVSILVNNAPFFQFPSGNMCTPFLYEGILTDSVGDGVRYTNNFGENKNLMINLPAGYTVYSDTNCSTLAAVGSMGATVGTNANTTGTFNFYIKADATPAPGAFFISQGSGGTTGYLNSSSVQLTVGP